MRFLATLPSHPGFFTALEFILIGFFLVIMALFALSGFIGLLGLLFRKKAGARSPAVVASEEPPVLGDASDPAVMTAVIAAAVHVALKGRPHRIVRVSPVGIGWAQEGRREIFSSHRVR